MVDPLLFWHRKSSVKWWDFRKTRNCSSNLKKDTGSNACWASFFYHLFEVVQFGSPQSCFPHGKSLSTKRPNVKPIRFVSLQGTPNHPQWQQYWLSLKSDPWPKTLWDSLCWISLGHFKRPCFQKVDLFIHFMLCFFRLQDFGEKFLLVVLWLGFEKIQARKTWDQHRLDGKVERHTL